MYHVLNTRSLLNASVFLFRIITITFAAAGLDSKNSVIVQTPFFLFWIYKFYPKKLCFAIFKQSLCISLFKITFPKLEKFFQKPQVLSVIWFVQSIKFLHIKKKKCFNWRLVPLSSYRSTRFITPCLKTKLHAYKWPKRYEVFTEPLTSFEYT